MDEQVIEQICIAHFSHAPQSITRCAVGLGNYVYAVTAQGKWYIIRCSPQPGAYTDTIFWLSRLDALDVPVPKILGQGQLREWDWLILSYIEGEEIGAVYPRLSREEKRAIAKEVVSIQRQAAKLSLPVKEDWSWHSFIWEMLDRAEVRIRQNGYFDTEKVARLRAQLTELEEYFRSVAPTPYLDDISSKNLIIQVGQVSGIIDVDWMGVGDVLTFAALTNMALLDLEYDTEYVDFLLEEMQITEIQRRAFTFYTLMYCVDFMGERGMQFVGRTVPVSLEIIEKLNRVYDGLWHQWIGKAHT